jgi:acetyl-CoA carboxylase alpha subunit
MNEPANSVPAANVSSKRRSAEVYSFLESLIEKRQQEIAEIEQMVERYERRVRKEEQAYRTMSPIRRMLAGKKPDHHVAVEYIHYVKKPMEKARLLRAEIAKYREMLNGTVPIDISDL